MNLIIFRKIRSTYHLESGENATRSENKCYQLSYTILKFNDRAGNMFDLDCSAVFDKGGVAMWSRYCPIKQYTKKKPAKFRVDLSYLMAHSIMLFITSMCIRDQIQKVLT